MTVTRPAKSELVHRIAEYVELRCKTDVAESDSSRVNVVSVGKYTKELNGIVCSVHAEHPLGPDMVKRDAMAEGTPRTLLDRAWNLPAETIGGCRFDSWLGTVMVRMLKQVSPENAVEIIDKVTTRIALVINDEAIVPFTGSMGYHVFYLGTAARYGYASGGGTTSVDAYWCDWVAKVSYSRSR